jgi:hypothetical protein
MEERSLQIVSMNVPAEWVCRPYRPDYGIDFAFEVFENNPAGKLSTMGEHFFVQLKSANRAEIVMRSAGSRINVEKAPIQKSKRKDARQIECIRYVCEVPLLNTVNVMGSANVVLLFLAILPSQELYFLCLNDYVDKVLRPEKAAFSEQKDVTIYIPTRNEISRENPYAIDALRLYARRSKLYAAFNLFNYQMRELRENFQPTLVPHFLDRVLGLDIWGRPAGWLAPSLTHPYVLELRKIVERENWWEDEINEALVEMVWGQLTNLGGLFEELARECFLPTELGQML